MGTLSIVLEIKTDYHRSELYSAGLEFHVLSVQLNVQKNKMEEIPNPNWDAVGFETKKYAQ